jgi:hypothetical protein
MLVSLFQQDYRRRRDRQKALDLVSRHGDRAIDLLAQRIKDPRLSARDRRHWKRVLQYARRFA